MMLFQPMNILELSPRGDLDITSCKQHLWNSFSDINLLLSEQPEDVILTDIEKYELSHKWGFEYLKIYHGAMINHVGNSWEHTDVCSLLCLCNMDYRNTMMSWLRITVAQLPTKGSKCWYWYNKISARTNTNKIQKYRVHEIKYLQNRSNTVPLCSTILTNLNTNMQPPWTAIVSPLGWTQVH